MPKSFSSASWTPAATGLAITVSAVGDSITAGCNPNLDLFSNSAQATYANDIRCHFARSWLAYGAMRSGGSWCIHEYLAGKSGATSADILASCVPALLNFPYGKPDACVVLAGTNDVNGALTIQQSLQNIRAIYNALLAAGIMPIAATIPPKSVSTQNVQQLNWGIYALAREFRIPVADFYSALVNPANGQWVNANYTADGTHPTPLGCAVMGYALNQAISNWVMTSNKAFCAQYDLTGSVQTFLKDPNFLTVTGTTNLASSYPSGAWSAPGTLTMSTVYTSAGTEPGTGHTMWANTPAIVTGSTTPNYIGNSWTLQGNGTNTTSSQSTGIPVAAGDRVAVGFRIKIIMDQAAVSPGKCQFQVNSPSGGRRLAGFAYDPTGNNWTTGQCAQVGNETNYVAGDFYQEFTVLPQDVGNIFMFFSINNMAGTGSNANDSVTVANARLVNLTQAGYVNN